MDNEFKMAEYQTLRKEVEASVEELARLERNCVFAVAAVYTWLATAPLNKEFVSLAWSVPVLVTVFSALKSISAGQHLQRLSGYIKEIEHDLCPPNGKAQGWEHFHARATGKRFRTKVQAFIWIVFIALTLFVALNPPVVVAGQRMLVPTRVLTSNG